MELTGTELVVHAGIVVGEEVEILDCFCQLLVYNGMKDLFLEQQEPRALLAVLFVDVDVLLVVVFLIRKFDFHLLSLLIKQILHLFHPFSLLMKCCHPLNHLIFFVLYSLLG